MSDTTDQPTPSPDDASSDPRVPGPEAAVDVEAEQDRIDALAAEAAKVEADAGADLEPGGAGRIFADRGVRADVAEDGDTDTPPADA